LVEQQVRHDPLKVSEQYLYCRKFSKFQVDTICAYNDTSVQSQAERDRTVAANEGGSSKWGVVKFQCEQANAHSGCFHRNFSISVWQSKFIC